MRHSAACLVVDKHPVAIDRNPDAPVAIGHNLALYVVGLAKERGIEHLHPDAPGAGAVYILEHPVRRHGDAVAPVVAEIAPAERLALPGRRQPQWLHHRVGHIAE